MNLKQELEAPRKQRAKEKLALKTEPVRYTLKSLSLLIEALAMGVTSGYAIYSGWFNTLPRWGSVALLVAGAFIALRAFVEFVKFLNRRA